MTGALSRLHHLAVPGRSRRWLPPVDPGGLISWLQLAEDRLGARIADWAVQLPSDQRRRRFGLLLFDESGAALAFAKFVVGAAPRASLAAQQALTDRPPRLCWVPALLLSGTVGEWHYTLTSVMPQGPHSPAVLDPHGRAELVAEYQTIIAETVIPTSQLLVPVHGDFGPWNVRRLGDGQVAIIDWEEAGWGPQGIDELWHSIHTNILRHRAPSKVAEAVAAEMAHWDVPTVQNAIRYWLDWIAGEDPEEVAAGTGLSGRQTRQLERLRVILQAIEPEGDEIGHYPQRAADQHG
jgi:hypothetical protein